MATINKHNRPMVGLKKVSGETGGYANGCYDEIFYDCSTGRVWTVFQCSLGHNSWTVYDDDDIIKIGNADRHITMQELADWIDSRMSELESILAYRAACA